MSIDVLVHLSEGRMPTPQEWQSAITATGFPVSMDTDFDVKEFKGFLPCTYKELPAGFEYYYSKVEPHDLREIGVPESLPIQIALVTHSNFAELATSTIAAAVLANITDGLLVDTEEGKTYNGNEALTWAKQIVAEADQELAKPAQPRTLPAKKPWWRFW